MTDTPPITEREARTMAVRHYKATHAGWLLACDAEKNITEGKRIFRELSLADQTIAEQYRDHCLAAYQGEGNG